MKQIPLLQGKALLIEMPEGATDYHVCNADGHESFSCFFIRTHTVDLPPGNWRIIGMLSEVTDAELADVTGFCYNKHNERYVEMPTSAMRATPIGDIEDAIKAAGYYLDMCPIKEPSAYYCYTVQPMECSADEMRLCREYAKAQQRVLCRERCLLLGREGL